MGIQDSTPVLRMELHAHEPFVSRNFHYFNEIGIGIYADGFHTRTFEP